jgi:hypothetical protein
MAYELIKSVMIKPRYSPGSPFEIIIGLWKFGINGKKRILKSALGRNWENLELKEKDFNFQTENEYIFYYINLNRAKEFLKDNSSLVDFKENYLNNAHNWAGWNPIDKDGNVKTGILSDKEGFLPVNPTDKKYVEYNGGQYSVPYYEILQDSNIRWIDGINLQEAKEIKDKDFVNIIPFPLEDDQIQPKRRFGRDNYYLNNGAEIRISWNYTTTSGSLEDLNGVIEGLEFSNNWGYEMNPSDIGIYTDRDRHLYKKTVFIKAPEDVIKNLPLDKKGSFTYLSRITDINTNQYAESQDFHKREDYGFTFLPIPPNILYKRISNFTELEKSSGYTDFDGDYPLPLYEPKIWHLDENLSFGVLNTDKKILNEIVTKWQEFYGNTKLKVSENKWGYYSTTKTERTLNWVDPTNLIVVTGSSGSSASGVTVSGVSASGVSASGATPSRDPIKGSYTFDVTLKNKMMNIDLGEFIITEKENVDPFVFGEEESIPLDSEYVETAFNAEEESPSNIPEVDTRYNNLQDNGSVEVNNTAIYNSPISSGGPGVKLPTGRSAYSHNNTQGYNLVDSKWYGDLLLSALAHIEHPTFDIPKTESGNLGCASWASMVFYRAFGVRMKDGTPVKAVPKSIGDFGSLGTGELGGWFALNPTMWQKIPWKEGKPGDIINTERGSSSGHVGVVLNEINKDGSYTIASNSSGGFGNSNDPLGCGKKNYSIKKWQSVTNRNPTRTFCWRYKGPKLNPGTNASNMPV